MKKEVCKELKVVFYWMTQSEQENMKEILAEEYAKWNSQKYRVCSFVSGKEDLAELTKDLLVHNKEVLAEQECSESQTSAQEECAA